MPERDMGTEPLNATNPKNFPPANFVCQSCGFTWPTANYDVQQVPAPDRCPQVYASGPCNGQIIRQAAAR
jgi:hypothetical protein